VVDALDEVERSEQALGTNLLYLPLNVPQGIYFVVTMRNVPEITPRVDCERGELRIDHDSADNLSDITDYVRASTARPGIHTYIDAQNLDVEGFVMTMVEKSEGNFMYLRYVLPEIEDGAYRDLDLANIPATLQGYYDEHWQRMKDSNLEEWFEYKLPTIAGLTVAQEPISVDELAFYTKLKRSRVRQVLNEWTQFLHKEDHEYEGKHVTQYRLYHLSFLEFVAAKDEVEEERVGLRAMHARFSEVMLKEWYKDE
jgi:hypothetical protein